MPKLLLADDSITIQRVIELTFSGEDMQVVAVGDGDEAIARIAAERPDIILADIGMPKRSGYDVAAHVKADPGLAHIPVLLLAGAFEPVDQARADQVRCDGVLVKPFEPKQLAARVRELVNRAKTNSSEVLPPRSAVEIPDVSGGLDSHPPGSAEGDSLDEYFDRLDAAFASRGSRAGAAAPGSPVLDEIAGPMSLPTVDDLVERVAVQGVSAEPSPPPNRGAAPHAAEQRDPDAEKRLAGAYAAALLTDELVDEVTRRVLERLAPDAVRGLVAQIVSDVAERLVREETARIRSRT